MMKSDLWSDLPFLPFTTGNVPEITLAPFDSPTLEKTSTHILLEETVRWRLEVNNSGCSRERTNTPSRGTLKRIHLRVYSKINEQHRTEVDDSSFTGDSLSFSHRELHKRKTKSIREEVWNKLLWPFRQTLIILKPELSLHETLLH